MGIYAEYQTCHGVSGAPEVLLSTYIAVIQYRANDPVENNETKDSVRLRPPRNRQRRSNIQDLRPVERDDTHSQTVDHPE